MVGGSLLENFAWGAIFLINIPIVIVGLVPTYRVVPESKDPEANPLDPIGALRSVAGLTALVYGIIEVPGLGWTDPTILGSLGAAVVLLGAFLVWERRVAHPMLDFRLLSNPRFTAASPSIALTFFALVGIFFFLTQYLQFVPGFSVLQTGLALVPVVFWVMPASGIGAMLTRHMGARVAVALGLFVMAAGRRGTPRRIPGCVRRGDGAVRSDRCGRRRRGGARLPRLAALPRHRRVGGRCDAPRGAGPRERRSGEGFCRLS